MKDVNNNPLVLIVMGSSSDNETIQNTTSVLKELEIGYSAHIASAHRTPETTKQLIVSAEKKGFEVIIAAAGLAAHLPGVCAAYSTLPIIGIPIQTGPLAGKDALYSIVMMPPGVPVAAMAIGKAGAKNAAIYAAQILSLKFPKIKQALKTFRENMQLKVEKANAELQKNQ